MEHLQAVVVQETGLRKIVREAERLETAGIKHSTNIMRFSTSKSQRLATARRGKPRAYRMGNGGRRTEADFPSVPSLPRDD